MSDDVYAGEEEELLDHALITLSSAVEKIFNFAAEAPELEFKDPKTIRFVMVQVLAQLLANHIDLFAEEDRERAIQFAKEQEELVYTLRAEHFNEAEPTTESTLDDPYGLAKMDPQGRA